MNESRHECHEANEQKAMNQQQSYIALDWVKDALDEILALVRQKLERTTRHADLKEVCEGLHQVSGTLQITQLAEPLVLAETLEQLAQAIFEQQLDMSLLPELALGVDLLRDELDQIQRTKRSHSIAIYRMVNHYRPLLARDPLRQRDWLRPDISLIMPSSWQADPVDQAARRLLARAMRHYLQHILAEQADAQDWQSLQQIAAHSGRGASTVQQAALWHVAQTLYAEYAQLHSPLTAQMRQLLIRLERSLHHGLDDDNLLADVLIHLGQQDTLHTAEARRLRQVFGLDASMEVGATPRVLESVTKLFEQSLYALEHQSFTDAHTYLEEASRLLDVAGWSSLYTSTQLVLDELQPNLMLKASHADRVQHDLRQLIQTVNQTVSMMSINEEDQRVVNDARHAAVRESRAALEAVKESLAGYSRSQWNVSRLAAMPEALSLVRGAFAILSLQRPAAQLGSIVDLLNRVLLREGFEPNWKQIDLLAEMVSAIEYYLDQLAVHYQDDKILDRVDTALAAFEIPVTEPAPEPVGGDKLFHDQTPLDVVEQAVAAPVEAVATTEAEDLSTEAVDTTEAPSTAQSVVEQPVVAASSSLPTLDLPHDDFDQDDEIREIFIEEAEEVLETIHEEFPKWATDFNNQVALKEFRRGFHTLKGSGRMVGARVVGELAWSIENMLNRVLDNSVTPSEPMVRIIEDVLAAVPIMVRDYAAGQQSSIDPTLMILRATALSKGLPPPDGHGGGGQPEPAPQQPDPTPQGAVASVEQAAPVVAAVATTAITEQQPPTVVAKVGGLPDGHGIEMPTDDFDQDDEIREIFIEEASEVLETIHEYFPQWAADFDDLASLKEFRRGFHTLKGSGRMVGARVVGELAWSVENMLNRVLDHTISPNQAIVQLIGDVLAAVPQLVEDFANSRAPSLDTIPMMYVARELTAGREVADVARLSSAQELTPAPVVEVANAVTPSATIDDQTEAASIDATAGEDIFDEMAQALIAEFDETVAPTATDTAASSLDIDPQLLEIFVAEAEGYLVDIHAYQDEFPRGGEVSEPLLRALHTLRGSAGMSNVEPIYRLGMAMENECKRVMREHSVLSPTHITILSALADRVRIHLEQVKAHQPTHLATEDDALIAQIHALETQQVSTSTEPAVVGLVSQLMELAVDDLLDAEWEMEHHRHDADPAPYLAQLAAQAGVLHQATLSMPVPVLTALLAQMQQVYQQLVTQPKSFVEDENTAELLLDAHQELTQLFDAMAGSQKLAVNVALMQRFADWLQQYAPVPVAVPNRVSADQPIDRENDPELLQIFLEEAEEVLNDIDQSFGAWAVDPSATAPLTVLQRHLHTLKGGARMARVESVGDLGHELETVYEQLVNGRDQASPELVRFMRHAQDQIARQIDQLLSEGTSFFCPQELDTLHRYLASHDVQVLSDFFSTAVAGSTKATPAAAVSAAPIPAAPVANIQPPVAPPAPVTTPTSVTSKQMHVLAEAWEEGQAPDPEMLEIFLDEAGEIIDQTSSLLAAWRASPEQVKLLMELQRGLHTLKGGARMAGVETVGDLSHEMEFIYEDLAVGRKPAAGLIGALLAQCHDWLADAIAVLDRGERPVEPTALLDALKKFMKDPASLTALPVIAMQEVASLNTIGTATTELTTIQGDGSEPPPMEGLFVRQSLSDQASNEMIRVSAGLMEKMINLSGENAINRARIEMGANSLGMTIEEMGATIQRLAEQLRRMDGELESQIIARHEGEREKYQDFDPLEMDQYSALNQLSKSLAESASDLLDLKSTLLDKVRDTESLLLQQSRIQSELQEGLMNSRLVPFSRLVPRLQRIVRQTATELGKPAELVVQNAEGELDRTVLERIVAPLEHMLRNAVDHGLEPPADRQAAQKAAMGTVVLNVAREGSEIVITLQDDGRGINVDAVRRKALERKLLVEDAELSDLEVMQFIFHAGLSTAEKVTQISGRGVGMDVVQSEIKLLGGTVSVTSEAGKGSCFTLRLPLTVAVTDALMVRVGDRTFAVPLSQVERIVRVNPADLAKQYESENDQYLYDGQNYRLRYMGELLHGGRLPSLQDQVLSLPLLLVKNAGGQNLAVQVDQLVGSRAEIVVKPVGHQLASVDGLSGATILGDGSVIIILDLLALARQAAAHQRRRVVTAQDTARQVTQRTVMVVDDSVTVRKVTSRLLERQGYKVVTAKDGVDAISQLEELTPDIMLLDIEMPRMDGFEVANLVRHNPRIAETPIIMITSRTGEKHRERAFQIGVNCYMGKPFQEQELLENIHELLGVASE
jgi:chemosensory pili system protein ChpA (sensor histidine kinase/response regulator)